MNDRTAGRATGRDWLRLALQLALAGGLWPLVIVGPLLVLGIVAAILT